MRRTIIFLLFPVIIACDSSATGSAQKKWNILFIAIDDLNDWTSLYGGPIRVPNLERLAEEGVFFDRAYCSSPACNPSRAAVMTGLKPSTTGIYGNKTDWRRAVPHAVTISQHFMRNGYWAEGAGKIFHHHYNNAFHDDASFHRFLKLNEDEYPEEKLNGITHWVGGRNGGPTSPPFDWGPWPRNENNAPDVRTVNYLIQFLEGEQDEPFFLAAGVFRPHSPWYAPEKYFSFYPLEDLTMPEIKENDLNDLPPGGLRMLREGKPFIYETIVANNQLKEAIQAYQACATFADAQIGRLLDALENSPYHENTVIVVWSDHGFHLGEKEHWEKFALWEKTTRTPLIVVVPGSSEKGSVCTTPVSLLDLYPTLIELCGLPSRSELEGRSLVPLLKDPFTEWDRPVVMTYGRGNHAVRSGQWRYIRYNDGSEELYDHSSDPNEWVNLAGRPEYDQMMEGFRKWIPGSDAEAQPDMKPWHGSFVY